MANNAVCTSCLRALRTQSRASLPRTALRRTTPAIQTTRAFSSTPSNKYADSKPPPPAQPALASFAKKLRETNTLRAATEPLVAYGVTEDLFKHCSKQCSYTVPSLEATPPTPAPKNAAGEDVGEGTGWWFQPVSQGGLGLDVTFNSWAQVQFLHVYLLSARLRRFPKEHAPVWQQHLLDHLFYAAEDRMAMYHGMAARGVRNKNLKDLWLQWRGILLSYDEGLINGDAVLAGAVWRNLFKGKEDVDLEQVAMVVGYFRRQLQMLDRLEDHDVATGKVNFGDAGKIVKALGVDQMESAAMQRPIVAEAVKEAE